MAAALRDFRRVLAVRTCDEAFAPCGLINV